MKHIRPMITYSEVGYSDMHNIVPLSTNNLENLYQILKSKYSFDRVSRYPYEINPHIRIDIISSGNVVQIFECEDEWFYIIYNYKFIKLNNYKYYKCDQAEGVIDCLEKTIDNDISVLF